MTAQRKADSLYGKPVRWTFEDGPTAGKTFEHIFYEDGSVLFRSVDGREKGDPTHAKFGGSRMVSDDVFVGSYLADGGYTLTVALNLKQGRVIGFASNNKEWYQQQGTFEVVADSGNTSQTFGK